MAAIVRSLFGVQNRKASSQKTHVYCNFSRSFCYSERINCSRILWKRHITDVRQRFVAGENVFLISVGSLPNNSTFK